MLNYFNAIQFLQNISKNKSVIRKIYYASEINEKIIQNYLCYK
jgi:hypothetical protein